MAQNVDCRDDGGILRIEKMQTGWQKKGEG